MLAGACPSAASRSRIAAARPAGSPASACRARRAPSRREVPGRRRGGPLEHRRSAPARSPGELAPGRPRGRATRASPGERRSASARSLSAAARSFARIAATAPSAQPSGSAGASRRTVSKRFAASARLPSSRAARPDVAGRSGAPCDVGRRERRRRGTQGRAKARTSTLGGRPARRLRPRCRAPSRRPRATSSSSRQKTMLLDVLGVGAKERAAATVISAASVERKAEDARRDRRNRDRRRADVLAAPQRLEHGRREQHLLAERAALPDRADGVDDPPRRELARPSSRRPARRRTCRSGRTRPGSSGRRAAGSRRRRPIRAGAPRWRR